MRVRTRELRYVRPSEIDPHPLNWRTHPDTQRAAFRGVIDDIGFAGAVEAVEVDGRLRLVDGHLRREELIDADVAIPVLVLDLDEREVAEYLVTKDPLAAMAGSSAERLDALLRDVSTGSAAVQELLADLRPIGVLGVDEGGVDIGERTGSSPWGRVDASETVRCLIGDVEFGAPADAIAAWQAALDPEITTREAATAWFLRASQL